MNDWPSQSIGAEGVYSIKCYDANGNLRWEENVHNLITYAGMFRLLNTYFTGVNYTATWYIGYIAATPAPTLSYADTLTSHAGWTESSRSRTNYPASSVGIFSGAGTSYAQFNSVIGGFSGASTITIAGVFLATSANNFGTLFSESLFANARTIYAGDTFSLTYNFYISAV